MTHAAFVLSPVVGQVGYWAGTTRPTAPGRVGLPGGKLDPNETPEDAVLREAAEEGWRIRGQLELLKKLEQPEWAPGETIWYYYAPEADELSDYKEKGRVIPVWLSDSEVTSSGYGNDDLLRILRRIRG